MGNQRRIVISHLLISLVLGGIPTLVVFAMDVEPFHRPFFIFDAKISDPNKLPTISALVAIVVSIIICVGQLLLSEYVFSKERTKKWTRVVQAVINMLAAFIYHISIQQICSTLVRQPRRCFGACIGNHVGDWIGVCET